MIVPDNSPRCAGCLIVSGTFRGDATPPDYRLRATLLGWSSDSVLLTSRGEYDVYVGTAHVASSCAVAILLLGVYRLCSYVPCASGTWSRCCSRVVCPSRASSGLCRCEAVSVCSVCACVPPPLCLQGHVRLNTRALLAGRRWLPADWRQRRRVDVQQRSHGARGRPSRRRRGVGGASGVCSEPCCISLARALYALTRFRRAVAVVVWCSVSTRVPPCR